MLIFDSHAKKALQIKTLLVRGTAGAEKMKRGRDEVVKEERERVGREEEDRGLFKRDVLMNGQSFGPVAVQRRQTMIDF